MATQLNLEEQEQLDQVKHFWNKYGNLITWVAILGFGALAAWNGWQWWQRDQAIKASAMFDELDKAVAAGDAERSARVFADLKERYPRTVFAEQGGLLAAKVQADQGHADAAAAALAWVGENAQQEAYRTMARLRLAGVLLEQKKYDEALEQLDGADVAEFEALVADRRGDVLLAQGKKDEARAAYQKAWQAMDAGVSYRRLIEAKLTALGAAPAARSAADKAEKGE